ncbi:MAG: hypothetical protein JWP04_3689 [Belnapia sp.]|nr:hypothetical protein [Belnapia sp.]
MTAEELATAAGAPPALSPPLLALWWDARGDWAAAHAAAQAGKDAESAWVHAYLHRKEGDLANAGYWYRRAGRTPPTLSLAAEWRAIAAALLA